MKLLFTSATYAPAWTFGGVVASWHRLLEEMATQGEDVTVFTTDAGLPSDDEGARTGFRLMNGVKVHYFKCDWRNPILSRSLVSKIRAKLYDSDLMHLAGVWQPLNIGVRRAADETGCPYVLSFHGALDEWSWEQKRLKKVLYYLLAERANIRSAAGIRYTSQMELDWSKRYASRDQEQRIVPNGIDFHSWYRNADAAKQWRAEAGIPGDCFLFLSAGRLHRGKNLQLALEALARLRTRKWHLAFVGKDEDGTGANLAKHARDLGFADRVSFHRTVPENKLPAIYSAGDLFVLPSHHENFSNAVLEALACQCAVLISDQVVIGGDLQGISGVQIRKRDVSLWSDAMASALERKDEFIADPADRPELERRFSISNCASQLIQFHRSVLARSRRNRKEYAEELYGKKWNHHCSSSEE